MDRLDTKNLRASFVVLTVALPFCATVSHAAGLGFERGVLTALVGGLLTSALGGGRLQISGPCASMGAVLAAVVSGAGAAWIGPVVAVAAIAQILAGLLGGARLANAMPTPVLAAAVCAAGLLQASSQVHIAMGVPPNASFLANVLDLGSSFSHASLGCLMVGAFTLAVAIFWHDATPPWLRTIPGPAAGVLAGAGLAALLPGEVTHLAAVGLGQLYVPLPGMLAQMWHVLTNDPALLQAALALAAMGALESLASAEAADWAAGFSCAGTRSELLVQGAGNLVCGLLGALPLAGAIPRSAANIRAGATGPAANLLHGVWLLAVIALVPRLLTWIPMPSLAAILVLGGWRLAFERTRLTQAVSAPSEVALFVITLFAALAFRLPAGLAAGMAAALGWSWMRKAAALRAGSQALPEHQAA